MADRLATIDIGRKEGGCCANFGGVGSPSNTMSPGPRTTSIRSGILIHPVVWSQQTWAENCGLCPFLGVGAGSSSNTTWPGAETYIHAKFHLDPSNRLATIHQRYRQTGQTGQRSDSIRRTVLQTVDQKKGS